MKRKKAFCFFLMILCLLISVSNADNAADGRTMLEEILRSYSADEAVLSNQLQVLHSNVNFRESPGGNVLGHLQGGELLECIEEGQYKGELWYHARSELYGDGYVIGTYAKPVWNNQLYWPLSEPEDIISVTDNMVLFASWMGNYQMDHGLSVIDADGMLSIAPMTVRGNMSLIPDDMKIQLANKLFEYGFICGNADYDHLRDDSLSSKQKNSIASSVLWKHYGTDNIWDIITKQSLFLFIHANDLHSSGMQLSERGRMLSNALLQDIVQGH